MLTANPNASMSETLPATMLSVPAVQAAATESILIVEDELTIRELLRFVCEKAGFSVCMATNLAEANQAVEKFKPDLILLDQMLPDGFGQHWLESFKLRPQSADIPVVIVSARDAEEDKVNAFEAGADDYIVKPFYPRELLSRVRLILRRSHVLQEAKGVKETSQIAQKTSKNQQLHCGPVMVDFARHTVEVDQQIVPVSNREFDLISIFVKHPHRVFSRRALIEQAWRGIVVDERTIDVHMLRIRKALANTSAKHFIETVRGVGYRVKMFA